MGGFHNHCIVMANIILEVIQNFALNVATNTSG